MSPTTSMNHGTCVIGELTNFSAFASIAHGAAVWTKQYETLPKAVGEVRRLGLIDRLFAVAATQYIQQTRRHCLSPLARKVVDKKLVAAGFRKAGTEAIEKGDTHRPLPVLTEA